MTEIGHNSAAEDKRLEQLIQRVENLNQEIKDIQDDRKDVFMEAKSLGYDVKIMREVIKIRAMDAEKRREHEMVLETYLVALGLA